MNNNNYYWVSDGNGSASGIIKATSVAEAAEIWDEMYNPYGFEVYGHPFREGLPELIHDITKYDGDVLNEDY